MPGRFRDYALTIGLAAVAAISTYYTTIGSLKLELAGKAEETLVANLDKRLSALEIRLGENFATRRDFYQLKEDLVLRLTRIETRLDSQMQSQSKRLSRNEENNPQIGKNPAITTAQINGQGVNR
jgi:hypothetical protein